MKQVLTVLFFNIATLSMQGIGATVESKVPLLVSEISTIPSFLDLSVINTAGDFIILNHLNRPLVKMSKHANLEGDLVDRWRIEDDFKKYTLHLAPNSYFSDGSSIRGVDVLESIKRQMRLNTANHFNFNGIRKVQLIDSDTIQVELVGRNTQFIRHLTYPEFGVLHKSQREAKVGDADFRITSGAYVLSYIKDSKAMLVKNPYFPFKVNLPPERILFQSGDPDTIADRLRNESVDVSQMLLAGTKEDFRVIAEANNLTIFRPHMGYTFWVSINPLSKNMGSVSLRNFIQVILKSDGFSFSDKAPVWSKANQLYLPDGFGRPSETRLNQVWNRIKMKAQAPKKRINIQILLGTKQFAFNEEIVSKLKAVFDVDVIPYSTIEDRQKRIQSKSLDLFIINNDFSSEDLHENLQTTFNPNLPLITTEQNMGQCQRLLKSALDSDDESKRHKIYEDISVAVLEKGYVSPIAHRNIVFVHNNKWDFSNVSTLYSDFCLWKISLKK